MIANARRGLCLALVVLGMARNLTPWEVYAVDDRETSTELARSRRQDEESGKGKAAIEISILEKLEKDDSLLGFDSEEETRVRWFVKEYDNRPMLSRVFERVSGTKHRI
jgi:hypothetical protein